MLRAVILDGGMGHMLRRKGVVIEGEVGTMKRFLGVALANINQPKLVVESHLAYLRAGATVITTNNYACVPAALQHSGANSASFDYVRQLIVAAGERAVESRQAYHSEGGKNKVRIAGGIPPLHESYRADAVGTPEELARDYAKIVSAIAPSSDLLLCETMSCVREGAAAAEAADKAGLPVWVSWTLNDQVGSDGPRLRSGERIEEAIEAVSDVANLKACLVNCSSPESVSAAIPVLKRALANRPDIQFGGYANGFHIVSASSDGAGGAKLVDGYREDLTPDMYLAVVQDWIKEGAGLVGGCCGIFPEHISKMADTSV